MMGCQWIPFPFCNPKPGPTTKYYPLNMVPTAGQELPEADGPQIPDFQIFQRKYPLGARAFLGGKYTTMNLTHDLMQVAVCKLKY